MEIAQTYNVAMVEIAVQKRGSSATNKQIHWLNLIFETTTALVPTYSLFTLN